MSDARPPRRDPRPVAGLAPPRADQGGLASVDSPGEARSPLPVELERFAAALATEGAARVPLARCLELFRTASPAPEGDPRQALSAALVALQAAGRLRLPSTRSKHLWDRERAPALPVYVSGPREARPEATSPPAALHPVLARAVDQAVGTRRPDGLAAADAWLKLHGGDAPEQPLAERSFEVFGDEKRLDELLRTRFARRGGLSPASFRAYRVAEPFAMTSFDPSSRWALAVENLATYDSLCRLLADACGARPAAVIFGRGNQFMTSCTSLPGRLAPVRRLVYFGDLDPVGLDIAREAQAALAPRVHVEPWTAAYELALRAASMEGAGAPSELDAAEDATRFLPDELRGATIELLARGARIPQESVGLPALRRLVAAFRDPRDAAWVHAAELRNHATEDPLLDWLERFGVERGHRPDPEQAGTSLRASLREKGRALEARVIADLARRVDVVVVEATPGDARPAATLEAMRRGASVIAGARVADEASRTLADPTLLVRSDVLRALFSGLLTQDEAERPAPALGAPWHYRVVDARFAGLDLTDRGDLILGGSMRARAAALFVANRALGEVQGFTPDASYLLGRSAHMPGRVRQDAILPDGVPLLTAVEQAAAWRRELLAEGHRWTPSPEPSRQELRPNLRNERDGPWRAAKQQIAEATQDLTLLARVGPAARARAARRGITRWSDPRLTAAVLGLPGDAGRIVDAVLAAQRETEPAWPGCVRASEEVWRPAPELELFVDFETVADLDDDPGRVGAPMIFMIGCGHHEGGAWRHATFTVDALTADEERRIVGEWWDHVRETRARRSPSGPEPWVYHWSAAEPLALARTSGAPEPRWFDLLARVFLQEPLGVRGAFGHGLKQVAGALHRQGLISCAWPGGEVTAGPDAMVGAWSAERERRERGTPLASSPWIEAIARYNEADCRALAEVLRWLRSTPAPSPTDGGAPPRASSSREGPGARASS